MSSKADLPDLKVWLAPAAPDHFHHQQALNYWEHKAADQVHFCTVTALVLVRLLSQPKLMGPAVKNTHEASALLQALCQQQRLGLVRFDREFERFGDLQRLPLNRTSSA